MVRLAMVAVGFVLVAGLAPVNAASNSTVIATVSVGDQPRGVAVNPSTDRVYVANNVSNNVSVIDGTANSVLTTVPVGDGPTGVAVNPTTHWIYVPNSDSDTVSVIDGITNTVIDTIPVGDPRAVAVDDVGNRIYVLNSDGPASLWVIDGATNTVTATVPLLECDARGDDAAVTANPVTNLIYISCRDILTPPTASVWVIDGASNSVVDRLALGESWPMGAAVNPATNRIYVADYGDPALLIPGAVLVIDGSTNAVVDTVPLLGHPQGVAVNPTSNRVYGASWAEISVIDGTTNEVVGDPIPVGQSHAPSSVAVNSNTGRIYVADSVDDTVSVIWDSTGAVGGVAEVPAIIGGHGGAGRGGVAYAVLAGVAAGVLAFAALAMLRIKKYGVR